MVERGIYGVSLWESLSPDLKSRVANDLLPVLFPQNPAEGAEAGKLQALVSAQPQRVRRELREALLATGLSPNEIERKIGPLGGGQRTRGPEAQRARGLEVCTSVPLCPRAVFGAP